MAKIVIASEIALERAIIRLQTVDQLREVLFVATPVVSAIEETKRARALEDIVPEVASELETVHDLLDATIKETGMIPPPEGELALGEEAKKIFEESSTYVEQKIREQFPALPIIDDILTIAHNPETEMEGESSGEIADPPQDSEALGGHNRTLGMKDRSGASIMPMTLAYSQVREYILSQGRQSGKLNLTECAKVLGLERDDVLGAVEALRREGKIVVR